MIPYASGAVPRRGNRFSRTFGRLILRLLGWRLVGELPQIKKMLAIAAPHSSNMDAVIGFASVLAMGLNISWMGKDSLFVGPLKWIARWGGGIAVNRSGDARGQVQSAIAEFKSRDAFWCALAPEGTRREMPRWKTGFYRIAQGAEVPLLLCHFDYPSKTVCIGPLFDLSDDMDADLLRLQAHYAPYVGKNGKRARVVASTPGTAAAMTADEAAYQAQIAAEQRTFAQNLNVHDLPEIFHYWSHNQIRPKLEQFGFSHPDAFFIHYLARAYRAAGSGTRRFVSIGAGNCDTEVRIAQALKAQGMEQFTLECLELNPAMLARGRALALEQGVAAQMRFTEADFNRWQPSAHYDGVIANQSLHHVLDLEALFAAVKGALKAPHGRLITSDMIGRNGHMRWPEALAVVNAFWAELPQAYRYNVQLARHEKTYLDSDCSVEGFEGIRAQDILPLLLKTFDFELFIGFGNVIDAFVGRSFGHHFRALSEWDRSFVDRVHARDEELIQSGAIKPVHMLAVVGVGLTEAVQCLPGLAPEFCVRTP